MCGIRSETIAVGGRATHVPIAYFKRSRAKGFIPDGAKDDIYMYIILLCVYIIISYGFTFYNAVKTVFGRFIILCNERCRADHINRRNYKKDGG